MSPGESRAHDRGEAYGHGPKKQAQSNDIKENYMEKRRMSRYMGYSQVLNMERSISLSPQVMTIFPKSLWPLYTCLE